MTAEEEAREVIRDAFNIDETKPLDKAFETAIAAAIRRAEGRAYERAAEECLRLEKWLPPEHDRTEFAHGHMYGLEQCARAIRALTNKEEGK